AAACIACLGVILNPVKEMVDSPPPLACCIANQQRQEMGSLGTSGAWLRVRIVHQHESEVVTQHLERRKLTDKIRIDTAVIVKQLQHLTDVAELCERIPRAVECLQLAPQTYEHGKAFERFRWACGILELQLILG